MLGRQSCNLTAAASEYRRRYGIEPPRGFEAWYYYAVAHASPIIDEFDIILASLAPLFKLSGLQVREKMLAASGVDGVDIWKCQFDGQTGETRCSHPSRSGGHIQGTLGKWLEGAIGEMPGVEFLVNHLDEPRVMLPAADQATEHEEQIRVRDLSQQPIWDELTKTCSRRQGITATPGTSLSGDGVVTHGVPFVTDIRADKDLCQHPEYRELHGMAMSPTTFLMVEGTVPILTTGTTSTMGDVLFPSTAYEGEGGDGFTYDEASDMAWEKKRNNLYWAGSTTGAYASDDGWKKYHRHRFVALGRGLEGDRKHWYLRERNGFLQRIALPFFRRDLFDVAFTSAIQCRNDVCESQRRYFDVQPRADKDAALGSKLVFDMDGNGISGRFVKLLASRSAVLKQTLLREWHDERLVPWVHYLPVSLGLGELPEMVAWLTGTEEGRRRAKAVADNGREWAARAMRTEDRSIYMFRLMLELARLQDPEREAM
ncbi:methyltransferase [Purpureocillium lavendulum]|uniref:Methyltransferase n=1 Tax=Purpureocillium lavendulum TaxID=1247861 RepID=A0AB34FTU4_9HYPO|nr:methyltransferase [Purpureocillium lavendulum]